MASSLLFFDASWPRAILARLGMRTRDAVTDDDAGAPRLGGARLLAVSAYVGLQLLLPLRHWLPHGAPRAVILAVHGMNDYSRAFEDLGEALAWRGIATYAYDQRGFGASPTRGRWAGTTTMVDDIRVVVRLVRARHPGVPLYLAGESMGGALDIVSSPGRGTTVRGTIPTAELS